MVVRDQSRQRRHGQHPTPASRDSADGPPGPAGRGGRGSGLAHGIRLGVRTLGELLITAGVIVLMFCAYELWFTNLYTSQQQQQLEGQLIHQWHAPPLQLHISDPPIGSGVGLLRIPRFGKDYIKVIVEGTDHEQLKKGPGHYPGTAMPGQLGNFDVAGHRTTYGAPFNQLDQMRPGDAVVIETRDTWFTYRVTGEQIVDPTDVAVAYPVPGHYGATPTQRLLTFTTCNPKYSAAQRLILRGVLDSALPKATTPVPPALAQFATVSY